MLVSTRARLRFRNTLPSLKKKIYECDNITQTEQRLKWLLRHDFVLYIYQIQQLTIELMLLKEEMFSISMQQTKQGSSSSKDHETKHH